MEYQMNMFDELDGFDDWLTEEIVRGTGFQDGKKRVYEAALTLKKGELPDFLKKEYGIGGRTSRDGLMFYNPKGIQLSRWKDKITEEYTWSDVAKEITRLIGAGKYLTEEEKEKYGIEE